MTSEKNAFWTNIQILNTVFGIIASIATLFTAYYSITADWGLSFQATVLLLSILNFSLVITTYKTIRQHHATHEKYAVSEEKKVALEAKISELNIKLNDSIKVNGKISLIVHNIIHEYRNILLYLMADTSLMSDTEFLSIQSSFKKYFIFLLANTKELFDIITGDDCSTCIKIFYDETNLKTFLRDPVSYRTRSEADKRMPLFPYYNNTAFKVIMNKDVSDTYYCCNNLVDDADYINTNPRWRHQYNAALVTPIRVAYPTEDGEDSHVLGFICVDNLKGNFDKDVCLNALSAIGDLCFNLFNTYNNMSPPGGQPPVDTD
ncbi:MAG: hypothetical protein FIA89_13080 [Geobacter sp.]|nr:hypothetical protein [Geobacter sp.]